MEVMHYTSKTGMLFVQTQGKEHKMVRKGSTDMTVKVLRKCNL